LKKTEPPKVNWVSDSPVIQFRGEHGDVGGNCWPQTHEGGTIHKRITGRISGKRQ